MSMTPLEELRHSGSHILATAVLRLFPDAKLDIGPPTDTGFYYDIDLDHKLTADDLIKLEAEMKKIAEENQPFIRKEVSREEAIEIIKSRGQERYKLGRLADIPEGEKISFYQNGEFMDLCAGTHLRYTAKFKAFKLSRSRAPITAATRKTNSSSASTAPRFRPRKNSHNTSSARSRPRPATTVNSARS
ncbi:MAG: hypothetical protein QM760_04570 [Nibricoccus sp.]